MSYIKLLKSPIFFLLFGIYNLYFSELKACITYTSINQEICEGQQYNFNGIDISSSGAYVDTLVNEANCDSIVTLNLIVHPTINSTLQKNICQGDSLIVGNHIYKTSGTYTDTLPSSTSCDSIIRTFLTVLPTTTRNISVTICNGESFSIGTNSYQASGNYRDTLKNSLGCDSIILLNLEVRPPVVKNINKSICEGKSYQFGSNTLTIAGTYQETFMNQNGCDSLVILELRINPIYLIEQVVQICEGESLKIGNDTYTTSGVYTNKFTSSLRCDSTIITTLTVLAPIINNISPTICQGSVFQVGSKSYSNTGIYRDTLESSAQCDSIVVTNLTVIKAFKITVNKTLCEGDSYNWNGQIITQNGTYKDTLISQAGCDSIVTLTLKFVSLTTKNISATICYNTSFQVGNSQYSISGNYVDTLKSINNCDSIILLSLTVLQPIKKNIYATICEGNSFNVGDTSYSAAGIYTKILKSQQNCDSTVVLNLKLSPVYQINLSPTICQGASFQVGNKSYNTSGIYRDTLVSSAQCDSIVITNLTVTSAYKISVTKILCEGESYNWNGQIFSQNGSYIDTLNSQFGCDSIVTLNLRFLPKTIKNISATICSNTFYQVGNSQYSISGNYIDTLKSINNCDSIILLNLNVLAPITRNINATICEGKSFIVGDSSYSISGNYTTILKSISGCDSTVYLNLNVAPQSQITLNPTICKGSVFQVGNKSYNKTGVYIDTLKNQFLCDSIITTQLTVKDPTSEQLSITICPGQTITIGQNTYGQQGVYRDTLKSVFGCDSIIILRLSIQSTLTFNQTINICQGKSYSIGQNVYTASGTYKDTLVSIGGCDSVVTTKLNVRPIYQKTESASICPGDSIEFGNKIIKTEGSYIHQFSSIYGCDSTVTLNVTVLRSEQEIVNKNSCIGKLIKIDGIIYSKDTVFNIQYTNQVGCDSIIEYQLTFYPTYQKTIQQNICIGQKFQNTIIQQDTIIRLKLSSIYGCDSIVDVEIIAIPTSITYQSSKICYGSTYNNVVITKDTIFTLVLTNKQGCDSTVVDTLTVIPGLEMTTSMDTTINPGSPVTLFASGADKYLWSNGSTSASIVVKPTTSSVYTVIGTAPNGCTQEVEIKVDVNACVVTAPTYFTPNGDGSHDVWKLKGIECLSEFNVQIINRWGDMIFQSSSSSESWDGNYKDKPAPEGVYFYILEGFSPQNKDVIHQNGYIHLSR
ncbi:MAG TPA: gliding motility-associated C-terminal domain-containing protein [Chitinophagales bacterium]|nr:gliding motility-associated C-terminal domain-containing protein [Chitinophagales bacterium]